MFVFKSIAYLRFEKMIKPEIISNKKMNNVCDYQPCDASHRTLWQMSLFMPHLCRESAPCALLSVRTDGAMWAKIPSIPSMDTPYYRITSHINGCSAPCFSWFSYPNLCLFVFTSVLPCFFNKLSLFYCTYILLPHLYFLTVFRPERREIQSPEWQETQQIRGLRVTEHEKIDGFNTDGGFFCAEQVQYLFLYNLVDS